MTSDSALFTDRRQKRLRQQLRDAVAEVRATEVGVEPDKRTRSVRQFMVIDEVEALLDHIEKLEAERG